MTFIVSKIWFLAAPLGLAMALAWWHGAPAAHAQEPLPTVITGNVFIDRIPAPDGTILSAWIGDEVIAEAIVQGGKYTLTMVQPPGRSYSGKLVTYQVGDLKTGDIGPWPGYGGAGTGDYNVYPGTPFDDERVARRLIRECVSIALGRIPSGQDDLTPQDIVKAMDLCPDLDGNLAAVDWEHPEYHVFKGEVLLFGGPAQDGTGVAAFIDGVEISGTKTKDGQFRLMVPQAPGQSFLGRTVEFRGSTVQGRRFGWLKSAVWKRAETSITLGPEVHYSSRGGPEGFLEGSPDLEALECIRGALGYLPANPQDLTQEQRNTASRACPGARDRLEQVLDPRAVDQANEACAERVLGYSPRIQAMTADETRRVQGACFWGKPIPGDPVPNRVPTRGFFTNAASGSINDVDKYMDPTSLAVVGIILTLMATSLSLVKGT